MPWILVLEDSLLSRRFVSKTLATEGFDVVEACSGLKGPTITANEVIACVLLDLLPQMDMPRSRDICGAS
ncbi:MULTISPECIES: response regulator [unclassified Leptolyngbya]|uniref:response regulator n=1 Tax=unclassified Leptolyngbya TaxID=2650499 RepID=UPI00168332D3|nr:MULTISPECIES: response regulator [unclassified Leptolyngbya]MBD1910794.1 response regulator [Leptolyngbya sp. FACHB-8]MBD2158143.1 response regulator [Leptolyngbya sp. FACHB-16]